MNVLLLKAWLARFGPALIGARFVRARQQDERSIILELESDGGPERLLLSVLEEYPVLALTGDDVLPEAVSAEGNFVKALNFHLHNYRLVAIEQSGFDRSVVMTFKLKDRYGQETFKILRPELAGRSANAFLISDRGMVISVMKRVRRDRERVREISTGKPLPEPPPLGKYLADSDSVEGLADELAKLNDGLDISETRDDLLKRFFTTRVAGCDQRNWQQLEPLIPVEYDLTSLADFTARLQAGEFNALLFELAAGRDENDAALGEWLSARRRRGMPRTQSDPQLERAAARIDQLVSERRLAEQADDIEQLALKMLGDAAEIDAKGKAIAWLTEWCELHPLWAPQVSLKRSVYENANELVHYAQRLRRGLPRLDALIEEAQQQLLALERSPAAQRRKPEPSRRADQLERDMERFEKDGLKLRRFSSSDGLTILCGLNDRSNDGLVRMYGSAKHLWLHARDHAGSHVVVLEGGEDPPQSTLEEAALIAAYYSQGRGEPDVDVSYLPMNQLRRPKNARPGQVLKLSERVITVRPQRFEQLRSSLAFDSGA